MSFAGLGLFKFAFGGFGSILHVQEFWFGNKMRYIMVEITDMRCSYNIFKRKNLFSSRQIITGLRKLKIAHTYFKNHLSVALRREECLMTLASCPCL